MNRKIEEIIKNGAIKETIKTSVPNTVEFKYLSVEKIMTSLGFNFTHRILDYGRGQGYFPQGEQTKYRKIRVYKKGEIYVIVAVLIMREISPRDFEKIVRSYTLNIPEVAEKFLSALDYFSNERRSVSLSEIADRSIRLARSIILMRENKISVAEWQQFLDDKNDHAAVDSNVDYKTIMLEDYLTLFKKKLHKLVDHEIESIIKQITNIS